MKSQKKTITQPDSVEPRAGEKSQQRQKPQLQFSFTAIRMEA
jgi:hypothetical protein